MTVQPQSTGDPISSKGEVIEMHVAALKLFNAIDPSPFREKDLDVKAQEFIVSWARDLPADASRALRVYLARPAGLPQEAAILRDAIRESFSQAALATRQRLRQLLRVGRRSLVMSMLAMWLVLVRGCGLVSQRTWTRQRSPLRDRPCRARPSSCCMEETTTSFPLRNQDVWRRGFAAAPTSGCW
jgi:hypothetical protein